MRATWVRTALLVILCVAAGVIGARWIDQSDSTQNVAPETRRRRLKEKPSAPRRKPVRSRSQNILLEQLQALGYVDGVYDENSELTDVILYDAERASPGYNFYSSRRQTGARLIDMEGKELHAWNDEKAGAWQHVELLPDGSLIAVVKDKRLTRYDKNSNRIWSVEGRFHHDLWVDGEEIYALARVGRQVEFIHPRSPTLVDLIQVYSLEGGLLREISVLNAIHDSAYGFLLPRIPREQEAKDGAQLDVLHANHVEVFDGRLADLHPMYAAGNILTSTRNINAIMILEGSTLEVLWIWGPTNLTFQHHPTLLDNGHILLFDNGSKRSRVIEIDPLSNRIVWQYAPSEGFFSKSRGSVQRLPNGNTLITESDRGYVLEVTPEGETVWKFANPIVNKKQVREAIWRMKRFDPEVITFLD